MNARRPVIQIKPTKIDLLMDRLAWLGLVFFWIFILVNYTTLPSSIPVHYNLQGEIDSYGSKATLFILPVIVTVIVVGLSILNRYPHIFNYPTIITAENAEGQYLLATRLIRFIKLFVVIIFIYLGVEIVQDAGGNSPGMANWILILLIAIPSIAIITYINKSMVK